MTLEALWDEADSLPFLASLGMGQGHAGMRLLQTASCGMSQLMQAAREAAAYRLLCIPSSLPGRGLGRATG